MLMNPMPSTTPQSGSFMTVSSANGFDDYPEFVNHVISSLNQVRGYQDFVFTDVSTEWANEIFDLLDERVPCRKTIDTKLNTLRIKVRSTWILDCVQSWMTKEYLRWVLNGDFTAQERDILDFHVGTTLEFPSGPYVGSRKEPDYFFQIDDHKLPTVAVECGWSESANMLQNDMNLLLLGGQGFIRVILLVEWTKLSGNRVSGRIAVFKLNRKGIPVLEQNQTIFPRPSTNPHKQRICLRRGDIFGPSLISDRSARDPLYLEIENFRVKAIKALDFMGLTPV